MSASAKPCVLVVDDEASLRELLCDALGREDIDITLAASGKEAMKLAAGRHVDLVITDLYLGDCTGLEVIDRLRRIWPEVPAVVISGRGDAQSFSEASRRHPVEMLNKPLDLKRLQAAVRGGLGRHSRRTTLTARRQRLRKIAKGLKRRQVDLAFGGDAAVTACRRLSTQLDLHKLLADYQQQLLAARNDDDVFKALFTLVVRHSGPLFGAAMVCDGEAQLQLVGRFGVPEPDGPRFCLSLAQPMIDRLLAQPKPTLIDAGEQTDQFEPSIRRYLVGLSVLALPLLPADGEMIGMVLLYRKGEQPFTDTDLELANLVARPTAMAVRRND